jgi:hypothetical protein
VTFLDGKTPIGTVAPDATGTAVLVTKTLTAGPNNITASYSGDAALTPLSLTPCRKQLRITWCRRYLRL